MAISVDIMLPGYRDIDRGETYRRRPRVREFSFVTRQVSRQSEGEFRHQLCLDRRRRKSRHAILVCLSLDREIRDSKLHHVMATGGFRIMPLSLAEDPDNLTSGYRIRDAPRWTNRFVHGGQAQSARDVESRGSASSGWTEIKKEARKGKRRGRGKKSMGGVGVGLCFASVASQMLSRSLSARKWRACVDISAESGVTRFAALTRPCPSCRALLCHFSASLGNHISTFWWRGCRTRIDFHFLPMLCFFLRRQPVRYQCRTGPVLAPDDGFIKQGEPESRIFQMPIRHLC